MGYTEREWRNSKIGLKWDVVGVGSFQEYLKIGYRQNLFGVERVSPPLPSL